MPTETEIVTRILRSLIFRRSVSTNDMVVYVEDTCVSCILLVHAIEPFGMHAELCFNPGMPLKRVPTRDVFHQEDFFKTLELIRRERSQGEVLH